MFREIHHEHHQQLGVSPKVERLLPAFMAATAAALFLSRDRRGPRAIVVGVVAAYYVWVSSLVARARESLLAAYGFAIAGAALSLVFAGLRQSSSCSCRQGS